MYVARRGMKNINKNNEVVVYKHGDVISDFEEWNALAKRTLLKNKWVTQEAEEEQTIVTDSSLVTSPKKRRKKADVTTASAE